MVSFHVRHRLESAILLYFFDLVLSLLHVSLKDLLCFWLQELLPAVILGDFARLIRFIDLWLEAVLLNELLASLLEYFLAFASSWWLSFLNVLFYVMGDSRIVELRLDMAILVSGGVTLGRPLLLHLVKGIIGLI